MLSPSRRIDFRYWSQSIDYCITGPNGKWNLKVHLICDWDHRKPRVIPEDACEQAVILSLPVQLFACISVPISHSCFLFFQLPLTHGMFTEWQTLLATCNIHDLWALVSHAVMLCISHQAHPNTMLNILLVFWFFFVCLLFVCFFLRIKKMTLRSSSFFCATSSKLCTPRFSSAWGCHIFLSTTRKFNKQKTIFFLNAGLR